jgi:RNA polymerase sigma-70 factor (ECF subfamily)
VIREARFEQLVADTSPDLLAYALRRAKSPEDAADVVAETFLIAWRKLDKLPQGDEARLWLFGVARNVLRRGIGKTRLEHDAVERLGRELREATVPAESRGAPDLRSALARLPETQREVLLLAAWEELSPREIAAVTGVPVNLVRVRLHRARTRLRHELERPSLARAACT